MLNLSTLLEDSARRHPDRDAVVLGDVRVDYQTLNAMANQVANLLVSRGIKPGDKVALCARTCRSSRPSTTRSSRPARSWSR